MIGVGHLSTLMWALWLLAGGKSTLEFEAQAQSQRGAVPRHQNAFQLRLDTYTHVQSRPPDAASH